MQGLDALLFLPSNLVPRTPGFNGEPGQRMPWSEAVLRDDPRRRAARASFESCVRERLRGYVDSWLKEERDWNHWADRNQSLCASLNRMYGRWRHFIAGAGEARGDGRVVPVPVTQWSLSVDFTSDEERIEAIAAWYFLGIVLTPYRDRIGKCERCHRYFLARYRRLDGFAKRRFCGRSCKAARNTGARRAEIHARKVAAVRSVIAAMPPGTTDWRGYVIMHVPKRIGLTRNFLTRNFGKLQFSASVHGGSDVPQESPAAR